MRGSRALRAAPLRYPQTPSAGPSAPALGLSEEVFSEAAEEAPELEASAEPETSAENEAAAEPAADEPEAPAEAEPDEQGRDES